MNVRHLLVPVDTDVVADRHIAEALVDDAMAIARAMGAKVTLAHVAAVLDTTPADAIVGARMAETFRALEQRVETRDDAATHELATLEARARAHAGDTAEVAGSVVIRKGGTIPELIVEKARELAADIIVMATHGRRGLRRVVLGSVAERTAHVSDVPVLLLPAR